jgi:hypothetical protein
MIKKTLTVLAVAMLAAGSAFAGDKACCAKQVSNKQSAQCLTFANLNLNADQKAKLETWQADCTKAGCTKESRAKFLKQAQGILSKDQYAALKAECDKPAQKKQS